MSMEGEGGGTRGEQGGRGRRSLQKSLSVSIKVG
jgi:hypothetical protein